MSKYRSSSRRKSKSPYRLILTIAIIIVVLVSGGVLWFVNQTPDFPDISYVAKSDWGGIDWSNDLERQSKLPGVLDSFGESSGAPGESAETVGPMSKEEKYNAINKKYNNAFINLDQFYRAEIDRLISQAKKDYQASQAGTIDVSVSSLAVQYLDAGKKLEQNCDLVFYSILEEMRKELKMNGSSLDLADQAENEYKAQKNNLRDEILSKGLNSVK